MDRLDAGCLVSLAKRKEHFYASVGNNKQTKNRSKAKDISIRELGESVSTEADSGFDTLYSTTIESIIEEESAKTRDKIPDKPSTPPRRSPRHAVTIQTQDDTKPFSPSQHLSTSLDTLSKATNQILTRSRSLRLSGESSCSSSNSPKLLNLSLPSPYERNKHSHYSPAPLDIAKASTSLINQFDSSLLELEAKKGELHESGESTLDVSVSRSSGIGTSIDADDNNESSAQISSKTKSSLPWPMLHRDIPFSGCWKRNLRLKRSASSIKEREGCVNRIVYSPGVFHGRERLDVVRRLSDMNATHILHQIWSKLSAADLGRALQVNVMTNITRDIKEIL